MRTISKPGPILVYSKYDWDLERFGYLLGEALPDVRIGYAGSPEQAMPHLNNAQILYGWGFPIDLLRKMPKLRWVQKMGAGVDDVVGQWPCAPDVLLTRTDGRLIAARMAEYVLCVVLDRSQKMHLARTQQAERRWAYYDTRSIRQCTVGIAGLGEVGSEIAKTLGLLGATVHGWRRSPTQGEAVARLFVGNDALADFVRGCDVIVLALPLTVETKGIFGASIFEALKPNAHLVNVGRGGVLDESALLAALEIGQVSHATLDVFATEPLPETHPFWNHPKMTITPHICGPLIPEDVVPHFLANYAAFAAGRPLRNVIDLKRQY
jgi:glyoxylate/hydroxypyruvate reductase A